MWILKKSRSGDLRRDMSPFRFRIATMNSPVFSGEISPSSLAERFAENWPFYSELSFRTGHGKKYKNANKSLQEFGGILTISICLQIWRLMIANYG